MPYQFAKERKQALFQPCGAAPSRQNEHSTKVYVCLVDFRPAQNWLGKKHWPFKKRAASAASPKIPAMQALFVAWYNFARKHETLKGATPAMASGLSDHVWTIKELIERAAEL